MLWVPLWLRVWPEAFVSLVDMIAPGALFILSWRWAPLAVLRTCPCIVMVLAEISAGVRRKHRRTFDIILKPKSGIMCFTVDLWGNWSFIKYCLSFVTHPSRWVFGMLSCDYISPLLGEAPPNWCRILTVSKRVAHGVSSFWGWTDLSSNHSILLSVT